MKYNAIVEKEEYDLLGVADNLDLLADKLDIIRGYMIQELGEISVETDATRDTLSKVFYHLDALNGAREQLRDIIVSLDNLLGAKKDR